MCDDCGPPMGEELLFDMLCEDAAWAGYSDAEIWYGNGGRILIVDMDRRHLDNAIAYLERTLAEADASGWEMAPNGMDVLIGRDLDDMMHRLGLLEDERTRRGPASYAPLTPIKVGRRS